jgi:hypothetical protein
MKFQSGDAWTGNRNGRPKGPCIRTKITKKILHGEGDTFAQVISDLGKVAKTGDRWAVEKYVHYLAPYILLKPKTEVDITGGEDMLATTEAIAELSVEKRELVGTLMNQLKEIIYG